MRKKEVVIKKRKTKLLLNLSIVKRKTTYLQEYTVSKRTEDKNKISVMSHHSVPI